MVPRDHRAHFVAGRARARGILEAASRRDDELVGGQHQFRRETPLGLGYGLRQQAPAPVQLRPHGLTLRHFPQSFEFSTLGGWIATRSGGHFATLYTHIDDFVESLRVITPAGAVETRRLPGSGAGPSPDRLFLGSEGALGVITEAWLRLQDRPSHRATVAVGFRSLFEAARAVRSIAQAGLHPSNLRVLDPMGYVDFLGLWSRARLVLTDSGGLQEETTALGVPCLTLRDNTERPITVTQGTNRVVGADPARISAAVADILNGEIEHAARVPPLWDGHTAERIVDALIARA